MKIPLFSAFWCLLRALENLALAESALVLAATPRHAPKAADWHQEAERCRLRAEAWFFKWDRELRDPLPSL